MDEELVLPLLNAPALPQTREGRAAEMDLVAPLEPEDVLSYLLQTGLITSADLVGEQTGVSVQVRKNTSYIARLGEHSLLVKRAKLLDDPGVHREAAFYRKIVPAHQALQGFTPAFLHYDPERLHIVIRHYHRHRDLRQRLARSGRAPERLGARLGEALAILHSIPLLPAEKSGFEAPEPWILDLSEPAMAMLVTESEGAIDIVRRVQASPALRPVIEEMRGSLRADGLCHGDMRLDNLLSGPAPRLVIVDWELSGFGPSAWDVASLLANFVELWATDATRPADDPGGATTSARRSLARFRPILTGFWGEYRRRRPAPTDGSPAEASLSPQGLAQLVGLRLVQSALEYSQLSPAPTRESIILLSMAERFCLQPLESWVHILGLPLSPLSGRIAPD